MAISESLKVESASDHIITDYQIYYNLFNVGAANDLVLDFSERTYKGEFSMKERTEENGFQNWWLISTGTGLYFIRHQESQLVMRSSGEKLEMDNFRLHDRAEQWMVTPSTESPGSYYLIHQPTGWALTWDAGSVLLKPRRSGGWSRQHWRFKMAKPVTLSINEALPDMPFDLQTLTGKYIAGAVTYGGPHVTLEENPAGGRFTLRSVSGKVDTEINKTKYYLRVETGVYDGAKLGLTMREEKAALFQIYADESGFTQLAVTSQDGTPWGYLLVNEERGKVELSWDQFSPKSYLAMISFGRASTLPAPYDTSNFDYDPTTVALVWQVTGAFFLMLASPFPIDRLVQSKVTGILFDTILALADQINSMAAEIVRHSDNTLDVVKDFLQMLWEKGVIKTLVITIFSSLSYIAIGTILSRLVLFIVAPGVAAASLLAGFAIWQYQTIQAALDYIKAHPKGVQSPVATD